MRSVVQSELSKHLPPGLVAELLEAHAEAKRNFYLGGLRLSEVEGGRFCEAAFRLLEHITSGNHTHLGRQLDIERLIKNLQGLPHTQHPDAVRIHIPRALRSVYDIRNKRNAAHLADGIDPNQQDATLVVSVIDWVLAEFLRLYHKVSANQAQGIVTDIVTRAVPVIQDFNGFLKILRPDLGVSQHCLALLYQRGSAGATHEELMGWVRPRMRRNLLRTMSRLIHEKDLVHSNGSRYFITQLGQREVEAKKLVEPTN